MPSISRLTPPNRQTRRAFLGSAAGILGIYAGLPRHLLSAEPAKGARIRGYSACSWTLRDGSPRVFDVARQIGLDGVEVDMGRPPDFAIDLPAKRAAYKEAARKTGVRVSAVALGCLNNFPLSSDPRAPGWVASAIDAAEDFGVDAILLAFFGKGELKTKDQRERVGDILRDLGPLAAKKKVRLGIESTLSARDALEIRERAGSSAVCVYYDVGNSRHWGHDGPAEIRLLGDRICGMHFKDGTTSWGNTPLGKGKVDFPEVAASLNAIGYRGWITLECQAQELVADMKAALSFSRALLERRA